MITDFSWTGTLGCKPGSSWRMKSFSSGGTGLVFFFFFGTSNVRLQHGTVSHCVMTRCLRFWTWVCKGCDQMFSLACSNFLKDYCWRRCQFELKITLSNWVLPASWILPAGFFLYASCLLHKEPTYIIQPCKEQYKYLGWLKSSEFKWPSRTWTFQAIYSTSLTFYFRPDVMLSDKTVNLVGGNRKKITQCSNLSTRWVLVQLLGELRVKVSPKTW